SVRNLLFRLFQRPVKSCPDTNPDYFMRYVPIITDKLTIAVPPELPAEATASAEVSATPSAAAAAAAPPSRAGRPVSPAAAAGARPGVVSIAAERTTMASSILRPPAFSGLGVGPS